MLGRCLRAPSVPRPCQNVVLSISPTFALLVKVLELWNANPMWERGWGMPYPSTLQREFWKTNISYKQDISYCQKDQKGLRFFFTLSGSLACLTLSGFIYSFLSAGRKRWQPQRLSSTPRSPTSTSAVALPRSWTPSWEWASQPIRREYCPRPRRPLGVCPRPPTLLPFVAQLPGAQSACFLPKACTLQGEVLSQKRALFCFFWMTWCGPLQTSSAGGQVKGPCDVNKIGSHLFLGHLHFSGFRGVWA